MHTLRSHMSAVEYTCAFHRPTTMKLLNHKVTTSSYYFAKTANIDIFQSKTTYSSLKTYNSILIHHMSMNIDHL